MTEYDGLDVDELLDEIEADVVEGYPRDKKKVDALINRVGILDRAIAIANEYHDGHFALMKFTTNWRFCFGTPMLNHMTIVDATYVGNTMEEAIEKAIKQEPLLVSGNGFRVVDN